MSVPISASRKCDTAMYVVDQERVKIIIGANILTLLMTFHPNSVLFPGDYLSVSSGYYPVLVEVPRSTAERSIRLALGLGLGQRVRLRHVHRLMR